MAFIFSAFNRHRDLALENLALRQQLAVFKRRHLRPKLRPADHLFWVWLSTVWELKDNISGSHCTAAR
jgi:hypothetical protein